MKNNIRKIMLAAAAAILAAAALTGCGQARTGTASTTKETQAPVIRVTEKITEAPQTESEPQTQAPQTETQAPQTETPAPQSETQPQTSAPLTKEQEMAQETKYTESKTMWAKDDVNVRDTPTTEEENISYSFDQGQTATVIGETPGWYEVSIPYTDNDGNPQEYTGFVSKEFLSDTEVQPKTDEERAAAAGGAGETTAPADGTAQNTDTGSAQNVSSPSSQSSGGNTVTMASDANIRADASQTSDVVGTVSAGEKVTVTGDADGWYQVEYNGVTGYVNKNLVG
jgi:uncharacterized protein YgiM (DUF1202 family)